MIIQRKRVAKRLASGLMAGALAIGGLAISGGSVSAKTPIAGTSTVSADVRVGGANRWETATKAADGYLARRGSLNTWNAIVVASGSNFPDALSASGLAGGLTAPVILLPSDGSMPTAVYEWAISRRVQIQANSTSSAPFTVYVVGGESAVPQSGVDALLGVINSGDLTPATSKRVFGANRAETAQKVALEKNAIGANLVFSPAKPIFLVNENSFADALSIAPFAFNQAAPILLTSSTSLSAEAAAVLSSYYLLGGTNIVLLGGTSAISTAVEEGILGLGFSYANITRISGADRYATSVAVNQWAGNNSGGNFTNAVVVFTNGSSFADGLAGAPYAGFGTSGAARSLVLVKSDEVPAGTATWLGTLSQTKKPSNMYVLGGTSAVSDAVPTAVTAATTAINSTSTLTCIANATGTLVAISVPGNITGSTSAAGTLSLGNEAALINANQLLINGSPNGNSGAMTAAYSDLTGLTTGTVTVSAGALTAGYVISWPGLSELANTAVNRVIAGSSCTIAADATPPVPIIDARTQSATADTGVFYVTFSEVVTGVSTSALTTSIATMSATSSTATQVGTSATWKFTLMDTASPSAAIKLQAGDVITISASTTVDLSGNPQSAAVVKTISAVTDADVTKPGLTGSMLCTQANQTQLLNKAGGALAMTATAFGPQGVAGNLYAFKVTNVRGQLIPKVTIDDAASSIVLTADLAYSSLNDVAKSMSNDGIIGWSATTSATATAPIGITAANTTASSYLNSTQKGSQSCVVTLKGSEAMKPKASQTATVVVNGISLGSSLALTPSSTNNTSHTVAAVAPPLPVSPNTVSVTLSGSLYDTAGNTSATLISF